MADKTTEALSAAEPGLESSAHAVEAAHGAAHGAEHVTGMPQLDFATFPNQIFWLLVALAAIYYVLSRIALPRIAAVLAERQGTITNDLAAAEELKLKAQEAEKAYDKALAEARAEASRIAAEAKAEIQAELNEAIAESDAEISAKSAESEARIAEIREGMMQSVEQVAKDTTGAIVEAMGASADAAAINAAVEARLRGGAA